MTKKSVESFDGGKRKRRRFEKTKKVRSSIPRSKVVGTREELGSSWLVCVSVRKASLSTLTIVGLRDMVLLVNLFVFSGVILFIFPLYLGKILQAFPAHKRTFSSFLLGSSLILFSFSSFYLFIYSKEEEE